MPIPSSGSLRRPFLTVLLVLALLQGAVAVSSAGEAPSLDTSACEPSTRTRLDWIVERLDSRSTYADLWWKGWLGVYGLGAVVESVQAGRENDRGQRADRIVSAVKAVGGVTRLALSQPTARRGADPLRSGRPADEAACRERVAQGEELLKAASHESETRWDWKAHAFNVGVNLAGALIVTQGFDESDGWESGAVGIVVGEAMLWSHPWTGRSDYDEYQTRFAATDSGPKWALAPFGRGLQVRVTF